MSCVICEETYDENEKRPMAIFPCGHTYCRLCLSKLQNNHCPECRASIEQTATNYAVLKQIEVQSSNPVVANYVREIKKEIKGLIQVKEFFERTSKDMGVTISGLNEELVCASAAPGNETQLNILKKKIESEFVFKKELIQIEEYCRITRNSNDTNETSKLDIEHKIKEIKKTFEEAIKEDTNTNYERALELYKRGLDTIFKIMKSK